MPGLLDDLLPNYGGGGLPAMVQQSYAGGPPPGAATGLGDIASILHQSYARPAPPATPLHSSTGQISGAVERSLARETAGQANEDRVRAQIEGERLKNTLLSAQIDRYQRETPAYLDEAWSDARGARAEAIGHEDTNKRAWGLHPGQRLEQEGKGVRAHYQGLDAQRAYEYAQQADPLRFQQLEQALRKDTADAGQSEINEDIAQLKLDQMKNPLMPRNFEDVLKERQFQRQVDRDIVDVYMKGKGAVITESGVLTFVTGDQADAATRTRDAYAAIAYAQLLARRNPGQGAAYYVRQADHFVVRASDEQLDQLAAAGAQTVEEFRPSPPDWPTPGPYPGHPHITHPMAAVGTPMPGRPPAGSDAMAVLQQIRQERALQAAQAAQPAQAVGSDPLLPPFVGPPAPLGTGPMSMEEINSLIKEEFRPAMGPIPPPPGY